MHTMHRVQWRHYFYHPYLWSLHDDTVLWVYEALSLREVLYNWLIDGLFLGNFCTSKRSSNQAQQNLIFLHLQCAIYTHNMVAETLGHFYLSLKLKFKTKL